MTIKTTSYDLYTRGGLSIFAGAICPNCGNPLEIEIEEGGATMLIDCENCGAETEAALVLHLSVIEVPCGPTPSEA